jgi:hypothetical protein
LTKCDDLSEVEVEEMETAVEAVEMAAVTVKMAATLRTVATAEVT